ASISRAPLLAAGCIASPALAYPSACLPVCVVSCLFGWLSVSWLAAGNIERKATALSPVNTATRCRGTGVRFPVNVFLCYFESGYAVSKSRFGFADEGRDRGPLLARK
ncbi:unnamed protein product, partial [Pylaiella littoralis]